MATTKKPMAKKTVTAAAKPKKAAAKSKPAASGAETYTKPELRERIKTRVQASDKGGRPGQWSARKAQLVASEYEKEGGGYKQGSRTAGQKHLESWTDEKWQTADGEKAIQGKSTSRYLPGKAWEKLTPAEKKATDNKKKTVSKSGKQHVPNTAAARKARQETAA